MLDRNRSYDGYFDLGKIPYSKKGGLNLVRINLHLTWTPENSRRRGYWCFLANPEIRQPHGSNNTLMDGKIVFEVIEVNGWRKYLKEKTLYDKLYNMRYWMNNYLHRGTPSQERDLENARREGVMIPGNEMVYLRSMHMDTLMYTGLGYTREYRSEAYTYGDDLLIRELPIGVENELEKIFEIPYVYRKLNNAMLLSNRL